MNVLTRRTVAFSWLWTSELILNDLLQWSILPTSRRLASIDSVEFHLVSSLYDTAQSL